MPQEPVELQVGGQVYKVRASTSDAALRRYAELVQERLRQVTGKDSPAHPQALFLAALALAHDLEEERALRLATVEEARTVVSGWIERVEEALDWVDEDGEPLEAPGVVAKEPVGAGAAGSAAPQGA